MYMYVRRLGGDARGVGEKAGRTKETGGQGGGGMGHWGPRKELNLTSVQPKGAKCFGTEETAITGNEGVEKEGFDSIDGTPKTKEQLKFVPGKNERT